jgi:hypothetical protein
MGREYNNIPPMPDKYLMPDGSIVTFSGAEVAPADETRAQEYRRRQEQVAKWILPDGSIVAGLPMAMGPFEALFVPITRTINGHALNANIVLTPADLGIVDPWEYKGTINCSTNPNYPAADAGHVYIVSVAGKIGGASGVEVSVNDKIWCKVDDSPAGTEAEVGTNWDIIHAISSDIPIPEEENDMLIAEGSPLLWVRKSLADIKEILEITEFLGNWE